MVALILASLLGPQERHEETLSMFEGGVGTQRGLHLAHFHAAVLENETSALANASVGVCGSDCARRETASVVANASALGYDGALDSACPAMTAALGSRTTLRLGHGAGHAEQLVDDVLGRRRRERKRAAPKPAATASAARGCRRLHEDRSVCACTCTTRWTARTASCCSRRRPPRTSSTRGTRTTSSSPNSPSTARCSPRRL